MKIIVVFIFLGTMFYSSSLLAEFKFQQAALSQQDFERAVDVSKAKKSDTPYRVLYENDLTLSQQFIIRRVKTIWYFPNANDVQQFGQGSLQFNEHTQKVTLLNAVTILPDGNIYPLSVEDTKQIDSNTYNVFSSWQNVLFNFPKLEAGGFTVLEYEIVTERAKMELDWFLSLYPQIYYKTGEFKFSANWDSSVEPNINIQSQYVSCNKTSNNLVCVAQSVPAAIYDENIFFYDEVGYVEMGELNAWDDVISSSKDKFNSAYSKSPEHLQTFLNDELGDNYSKKDALDFIHEYVSRKVRYLSQSEFGHAVTPHKTKITLEKMIGDCKDKTALFIDLAKQAGIDAYPVLISTSHQKNRAGMVPSLAKFNHVIACYHYNKKEYCSDLTDIHTYWQNTSSWIQGKFSLRLLSSSLPQPLMSDKFRWRYNIETKVQLNKDGGMEESQTRTYENLYSSWFKRSLAGKNTQERKRWLIDVYQNVVAEPSSPNMSISGLKAMDSQVVIHSSTSYAPFLDTKERFNYTESDAWLLQEVNNNYTLNKYYDESITGTLVRSRYIFQLPKPWQLMVPTANVNLVHRYGSLVRTSSQDKLGQWIVETTLSLPKMRIPKEELNTYNQFLDALKKELTIRLIGKTTG